MQSNRIMSYCIAVSILPFLLLIGSCGQGEGDWRPNATPFSLGESNAPADGQEVDVRPAEVHRVLHEVLPCSLVEQLDQDPGPKLGATMRNIVDYGLAALPKLCAVVRDSNQTRRKRENAFFVVKEIGYLSHEVSELFVYVLTNDDFSQRRHDYIGFAVKAGVRSPEVQNAIAMQVRDPSSSVRLNALAAAISLGFTYKLKERDLIILMDDQSPLVRMNACLAVGKLSQPCPATLKQLSWRMLYDKDETVRRAARQSYVAQQHYTSKSWDSEWAF